MCAQACKRTYTQTHINTHTSIQTRYTCMFIYNSQVLNKIKTNSSKEQNENKKKENHKLIIFILTRAFHNPSHIKRADTCASLILGV